MAEQAHFAYRVQLPDGSETIRTGAAPEPPTFGQLADFSANRGERFLGMVPMSPVPEAAASQAPPPAPTPPQPSAPPPSAPPARGIGAELKQVYLPERTFTSELPSIGGGILGGAVGATVGGPFVPVMAGVGSATGEAAQIGAEQLMGWPPAEAGSFGERVTRAAERGFTGEVVAAPVRAAVRYAGRAVSPTLTAVERLQPVLTQEVPAASTLVHAPEGLTGAVRALPIDDVLARPAEALQGVTLTPEMQQTLLTRWWQRASDQGPRRLVAAWDALGEAGQQAIAGGSRGDMARVVNTLRPAAEPLWSAATLGRGGLTGLAAGQLGLPHDVAVAAGAAEEVARRLGPRALLYPGPAGFIASLPQVARVASPWASGALRTLGQGTQYLWPDIPPAASR